MKRTIQSLATACAPALLIPLAVACSSQQPAQSPTNAAPPMEPGAPSTMPAPGTETPAGPTGQLGMPEQGGAQPPAPRGPEGQPGQQGLGSGLGQEAQPTPAEGGQAAQAERAACATLANDARLRVEDVQHGIAIVLVPRAGSDLPTVRDDAHHLESAIHAGAEGHGQRGEACGIAELGRLPSVTTSITESDGAVRIIMTTSNPGEVRDLRRIARDEAAGLNKAAGPGRPHPQSMPPAPAAPPLPGAPPAPPPGAPPPPPGGPGAPPPPP
jgi:hypothetical protein